jgi:hypothetical protein
MGIEFEALRIDERRRLTRSMRCLRAHEAFILDQRTLTGVPVGVGEANEAAPNPGSTIAGWAAPAPSAEYSGRASRITATPHQREGDTEQSQSAFPGGLELAASVFADYGSD